MISAQCACGHAYDFPDHSAGNTVRCRKCGGLFKVPGGQALVPEPWFHSPAKTFGILVAALVAASVILALLGFFLLKIALSQPKLSI